jgi:hypothetical protein
MDIGDSGVLAKYPQTENRIPPKIPHQRLASIVPLWTVNDIKSLILLGIAGNWTL